MLPAVPFWFWEAEQGCLEPAGAPEIPPEGLGWQWGDPKTWSPEPRGALAKRETEAQGTRNGLRDHPACAEQDF